MNLVFDIGNTTIGITVIRRKKILRTVRIESMLPAPVLKAKLIWNVHSIQRKFGIPENVVICSVVPSVLKIIAPVIRKELKVIPKIIGKDLKVPIKNRYKNPRAVGQDRLVGAYAAAVLYGKPVIIIDFGTAITFDVVSSKGDYEGGIIVPGMRLSARSLSQNTALLPLIEITSAQKLIGKSTKESILSGLFFGYGALLDGIVKRLKTQIKGKPKVVMTGGYAKLIKKFVHIRIDRIDPDLVFKGMRLLIK